MSWLDWLPLQEHNDNGYDCRPMLMLSVVMIIYERAVGELGDAQRNKLPFRAAECCCLCDYDLR